MDYGHPPPHPAMPSALIFAVVAVTVVATLLVVAAVVYWLLTRALDPRPRR